METNKIHNMDCLEGLKQMEDNSVDLIVTDPPYGIDYQSARRTESERFEKIENDDIPKTVFLKDCFKLLKEESAIYLFTRWDVYPLWLKSMKEVGFIIKNCIVWDRMVHGLGDLTGSYAPQHDFIIFATKGRHILKNGRPKDIMKVKRPDVDKMIHPTEKPTALIRQLIKNSSNKEDLVLDPFMGSGSTAKSCVELERNYIGFELSEKYCKVANKRLAQKGVTDFFAQKVREQKTEEANNGN